MRIANVTCDDVRRAFAYDANTGIFTRRDSGRVVGSAHVAGYLTVSLKRVNLLAHRVAKRRRKWQAGIGINGRRIHLGYFNSKEEAHAAYLNAKTEFHTFGGSSV